MKKILVLVMLCGAINASAQISFSDSTNRISGTWYTGILAGPKVFTKDARSVSFYSLRVGGTITWSPTKWFSLFGLGAGEIDQTDTLTPFTHFCVKIKPIKSVVITLGKTSTIMTEIFRPIPTSAFGQFEPWTLAQIPGPGLGGKINISLGKKINILAGNFWRGTEASHEFNFRYGKFNLGGYYMNASKLYGGAINFVSEKFSSTIMYNDKKNTGTVNSIAIPRVKNFVIYSDLGFEPNKFKTIRNEIGFLKNAKCGHVQLMFGMGYDQQVDCVKGYLRINNI